MLRELWQEHTHTQAHVYTTCTHRHTQSHNILICSACIHTYVHMCVILTQAAVFVLSYIKCNALLQLEGSVDQALVDIGGTRQTAQGAMTKWQVG